MRRPLASLFLVLLLSVLAAAQAPVLVLEVKPDVLVGIDLETGEFRTIIYYKLEPPDPPIPWPVEGLHVIIVDDENARGWMLDENGNKVERPQEQINIFTSTRLRDWLDANCPQETDGEPAYRFSHPESLAPGTKGRELELPVWVQGWDAVMAQVAAAKVTLPAWGVSNGKTGVIEALPPNVDACLKRLEEFK